MIVKDLERHLAERVPQLHQIHESERRRKQVPLVIPEPGWKYQEPILSSHATEADVARLKEMAINAECDDDLPTALRLWEQINLLATKPEDRSRALKKTADLVRRSHRQQPIMSATPVTEVPLPTGDLGGSKPEPPPINPPLPKPSATKPAPPHPPDKQTIDAIPLVSERGIDYTKLHDLLNAQDWKAADKETAERMCEVMGRQEEGWLRSKDMQKFPCADLRTIDQLWVKHSQEKFGFSVQKEIWQSCGSPIGYKKNWEKFGELIGWKDPKGWVGRVSWYVYDNFRFTLEAPKGHLPSGNLASWWSRRKIRDTFDMSLNDSRYHSEREGLFFSSLAHRVAQSYRA